jgi:hypothetical protein
VERCNKACVYSDEHFEPKGCAAESRAVGAKDIRSQAALPTYDSCALGSKCLDEYDDYLEENCTADTTLAMAQVNDHGFEALYCPSDALIRGTIFSRLDLPFNGRGVARA